MRKLVFTLAFMLIGTFAFASSNKIVTLKEDAKIETVNSNDIIQADNYVVSDYSSDKLLEIGCIVWGDYVDFNGNVTGTWVVIYPGSCDDAIDWVIDNLPFIIP